MKMLKPTLVLLFAFVLTLAAPARPETILWNHTRGTYTAPEDVTVTQFGVYISTPTPHNNPGITELCIQLYDETYPRFIGGFSEVMCWTTKAAGQPSVQFVIPDLNLFLPQGKTLLWGIAGTRGVDYRMVMAGIEVEAGRADPGDRVLRLPYFDLAFSGLSMPEESAYVSTLSEPLVVRGVQIFISEWQGVNPDFTVCLRGGSREFCQVLPTAKTGALSTNVIRFEEPWVLAPGEKLSASCTLSAGALGGDCVFYVHVNGVVDLFRDVGENVPAENLDLFCSRWAGWMGTIYPERFGSVEQCWGMFPD